MLWRIEDGGEFVGHPDVVVVAIGINNLVFGHDSPQDTFGGIAKIVATIHGLSPTTKVVVEGLLPYGDPTSPIRPEIAEVNADLATLADEQTTYYINPGPQTRPANAASSPWPTNASRSCPSPWPASVPPSNSRCMSFMTIVAVAMSTPPGCLGLHPY